MSSFAKISVLSSLALLLTFAACSTDSATNSTSGTSATAAEDKGTSSSEISLEIADLVKIDSWANQGKAHAKLTERMAEVMSSVTDEASAKSAIEEFRTLASQFAAVNRAEKKNLGDPSADDKKTAMTFVAPANKKFDEAYTKVNENEELFNSVLDALDKAYVGEEF